MRYGAGLIWKLKDKDIFLLPLRGPKAPSKPLRIDSNSGKQEKEKITTTQIREGTEETVILKNNKLVIPNIIKNTKQENNLISNYTKLCNKFSYIPDIQGTEYIKSSIKTPNVLPKCILNNRITGYTVEKSRSIEILNDLILDINPEELINKYQVYDIENSYEKEGLVHYERPTVILNIENSTIKIYENGKTIFQDNLKELQRFIEERFERNIEKPLSTIKIQHRLKEKDFRGKEILIDNKEVERSKRLSKKKKVLEFILTSI